MTSADETERNRATITASFEAWSDGSAAMPEPPYAVRRRNNHRLSPANTNAAAMNIPDSMNWKGQYRFRGW